MVSLFGSTSGTTAFNFQQLDLSMLGAYYEAKTALLTGTSLAPPQAARGPAVVTPWEQPEDTRSLNQRVNEVKALQSFINPKSDQAKLAGDNKDAKALFTLYQAYTRLKAVAELAADKNTTDASRGPLDILVKKGLSQIQDYITGAALDKLDLIYGAKSNRVETGIGLGKNRTKVIGAAIQKGAKDDPIPGIVGNEVFTVSITKSGVTDNFVIDLSQIAGPITLGSLASYINSQIITATTLDSGGNTVPKYSARFGVESVAGKGYALTVSGLVAEDVSLSAAVEEPSLFLAGATRPVGSDAIGAATLTRLDGVDGGDPTRALRETYAGVGAPLLEVEEAEEDPLNGRTNAVVEKIRKQVSDLFTELEIDTAADAPDRPAVETAAAAVAVDSQGYVFVVGATAGDLGNAINRSDGSDVYLSKYDASGNIVWQRLLGANGAAEGFALAIDNNDNVIVAGSVDGSVDGSELFSGTDSFVAKFSNEGDRLWKQQLDTVATDEALAVTVDAAGDVLIAGHASGVLQSGNTFGGARDGYVARLSGGTGAIAATSLFGGVGFETAKDIAIAADGNILVASEEDGRAVVRKLDAADFTNVLWAVDLGDLGSGSVGGLAVEGGAVYLAGSTGNSGFGAGSTIGSHGGGQDGYVVKIDDAGASASASWTAFVGTSAGDGIKDVTASGGYVYVAGQTAGAFGGDPRSGVTDAFAAKVDGVTGATVWTEQIGGLSGYNAAAGIAFSSNGNSVLTKLGLGPGTLQISETRDVTTQTTVHAGDYFYIAINGGKKMKVTVQEGDTFERLASRINRLSLRYIKAEEVFTGDGRKLKISVKNGSEIQLFAGDGDRDALKSLGLAPTKIFPNDRLFGTKEQDGESAAGDELGGIFGFKFEDGLNAASENGAKYLLGKVNEAISEVQRAYRSLYKDPLAEYLKSQSKPTGPVPPALAKQLANYQAGLSRLIAGGGIIT